MKVKSSECCGLPILFEIGLCKHLVYCQAFFKGVSWNLCIHALFLKSSNLLIYLTFELSLHQFLLLLLFSEHSVYFVLQVHLHTHGLLVSRLQLLALQEYFLLFAPLHLSEGLQLLVSLQQLVGHLVNLPPQVTDLPRLSQLCFLLPQLILQHIRT